VKDFLGSSPEKNKIHFYLITIAYDGSDFAG
jgi:hypothetical protein